MRRGWVVAGIVVGVAALVVIGLLIAGGLWVATQGGIGPHVMMGRYGSLWGIGLAGGERMSVAVIGGGLLLLLFALGAGAVALLVIGLAGQQQKVAGGEPAPLDILKKRYAGGEIDREEFERMREELK